jgi:hypothetical protein
MPKKDSLKRAARSGQRSIGNVLNRVSDQENIRELKKAYGRFKQIERELDYMEEEIHMYHIRNSEFPGDEVGRPADDFDD